MGQSAGSFSIWPWRSYSHARLSFPFAIIYHNFEGQGEKQTYNFSIGFIHSTASLFSLSTPSFACPPTIPSPQ